MLTSYARSSAAAAQLNHALTHSSRTDHASRVTPRVRANLTGHCADSLSIATWGRAAKAKNIERALPISSGTNTKDTAMACKSRLHPDMNPSPLLPPSPPVLTPLTAPSLQPHSIAQSSPSTSLTCHLSEAVDETLGNGSLIAAMALPAPLCSSLSLGW